MKKIMLALILAMILPAVSVCAQTDFKSHEEFSAVYTEAELEDAKAKLSEKREELDITSLSINIKENAVTAGSAFWNNEKKQRVIETAGISNIIFELYDGYDDSRDMIHYELRPNEHGIWKDGELVETDSYAVETEGVYMLPIGSMFRVSGCETDISMKEYFRANASGSKVEILENGMNINDREVKFLIKSRIGERECFVSYNDLKDFVGMKNGEDVVFFWDVPAEGNMLYILESAAYKNDSRRINTFTLGSEKYYFDGKEKLMTGDVYNENGSIMIPVRTVGEMLGPDTSVFWDKENRAAVIETEKQTLCFIADTDRLIAGGIEMKLDTPVKIRKDRLYVPVTDLQAVAGYMGKDMDEFDIYFKDSDTLLIRI